MDLPQFETLCLASEQGVARVTLNRPDKANAMNAAMWRELQTCFEWLDEEATVRAVVLRGAGRHFCSGIDLGMFAELSVTATEPARRAEQLRRTILRLQDNLTALERCRKPVLAAIHGACIGGGIDLTCCADVRYASADAHFAIREIDIGMVADVGTLQRLPRLIGDGLVRELAYTGRNMGADEAASSGFVTRVFPDHEALDAGVMAIARTIAAKSPLAIRGSKEMLLHARDHSVREGLNYIATWNAGMLSQADMLAAMGSRPEAPADFED